MGNNADPITLHKYLYANVDPANTIDPTGNFGFFGTGVANTIVGIMTELQVQNGFSVLDQLGVVDSDIQTASQVNKIIGIATMGAAGIQLVKLLSKKFAKNADQLAGQIGNSQAFVFVNRQAAAQILTKRGYLLEADLRKLIPAHMPNIFIPSKNIEHGFKYKFDVLDNVVEVKWHSPQKNIRFPDSPAAIGWTAQIKMNGKLLGADGRWYDQPSAITHIPLLR